VTEPVRQPAHPGTTVEPVDESPALARRNNLAALALFAVVLVLAGGTVVVALVYNALADY
jgi:hypothetical protein